MDRLDSGYLDERWGRGGQGHKVKDRITENGTEIRRGGDYAVRLAVHMSINESTRRRRRCDPCEICPDVSSLVRLLQAMTISCCMRELAEGCLTFSRLNHLGLADACEGDMDSTLTMLISTGKIIELTGFHDRGCRPQITTEVSNARHMARNWGGGLLNGDMMTLLHRVVFYGSHIECMRDLAPLMGLKVVEEV